MKVAVASENPVKLDCVREGFEAFFPKKNIEIISRKVPSGVSDQPICDDETLKGARNRVVNLKKVIKADYYVGIEGGVEEKEGMQAFAWIVVLHEGKEGRARTATFMLPEELAALVRKGMELGHANDILTKDNNSKQKGGAIHGLTKGLITRTSYYKEAVILSLIGFRDEEDG